MNKFFKLHRCSHTLQWSRLDEVPGLQKENPCVQIDAHRFPIVPTHTLTISFYEWVSTLEISFWPIEPIYNLNCYLFLFSIRMIRTTINQYSTMNNSFFNQYSTMNNYFFNEDIDQMIVVGAPYVFLLLFIVSPYKYRFHINKILVKFL